MISFQFLQDLFKSPILNSSSNSQSFSLSNGFSSQYSDYWRSCDASESSNMTLMGCVSLEMNGLMLMGLNSSDISFFQSFMKSLNYSNHKWIFHCFRNRFGWEWRVGYCSWSSILFFRNCDDPFSFLFSQQQPNRNFH